MPQITQKRITLKPSKANVTLLSKHAEAWGGAYWYSDGLRLTVAFRPLEALSDVMVLHTAGAISADSIRELVLDELSL